MGDEGLLAAALAIGLTTNIQTCSPIEAYIAGEALEAINMPSLVPAQLDEVVAQWLGTFGTTA